MAEISAAILQVGGGYKVVQGTITADAQAIDITATYNNAAVTFTAIKANITNTASAAASKLIDLQVGGVSQFNVTRAGVMTLTGGATFGGAVSGITTLAITAQFTITAASPFYQLINTASSNKTWTIQGSGTNLVFTEQGVATRLQLQAGGAIVASDTHLARRNATMTNGAGAASGTLTNAPAAGNPTKWLAVDDNGTTRYVPAW